MKVLQILQFVGLIAERIMFWKKSNNTSNNERREQKNNASNNERKEEGKNGK